MFVLGIGANDATPWGLSSIQMCGGSAVVAPSLTSALLQTTVTVSETVSEEEEKEVDELTPGIIEAVTHCDDRTVLDEMADVLVTERLAACAHVSGPVSSTYRWSGVVENCPEWELTAVTVATNASAIAARITAVHPYELPAVVLRQLDAVADYARWVESETRPTQTTEM